ncbi:MAG: hypothetical protein Q8S27_04855 [Hoeflea sp.]|uniref:hypothetical protein n=1 Tax=Hoeflea sp. TaxID=1940281 RepID=UPI002732141F|nr:hypothetical protein [Hoeflea sp.]MDP2118750.1 hypothetical protein [Hoeflea sp.]MDP3523886.1 hypothetical protein [Hoeflea sp.]
MIIYAIGPTRRPFEPSRRAGGRSAEDAFMELHGGRGARLIYLGVEWLASRFDAAAEASTRIWRRSLSRSSGRLSTDR